MNNTENFRAEEFCSAKLWEIVSSQEATTSEAELHAAVEELALRRHYLDDLAKLGIYQPGS